MDNFIQRIICRIQRIKCTLTKASGKFFTQSHTEIRQTLILHAQIIGLKGNFCTHFICRIATYPVDKIIRPLNNWGLEWLVFKGEKEEKKKKNIYRRSRSRLQPEVKQNIDSVWKYTARNEQNSCKTTICGFSV